MEVVDLYSLQRDRSSIRLSEDNAAGLVDDRWGRARGVGGGAKKLKKVVELPIPRPRGSFVPSDWYVGARDFTPRGH